MNQVMRKVVTKEISERKEFGSCIGRSTIAFFKANVEKLIQQEVMVNA